ncbi:serine/arginine repetitive matrix protein 3-like [Diceros bicornis minor]|uniref:serine/arginine repetitive matrix protein 3-like n=1 Tax=Diceros bicornis minor TaxID=77932 RepID=UPI0026EE911C|nr:serine/arginine repetitive matrix protein 3-like [Diceros bicornis minor]
MVGGCGSDAPRLLGEGAKQPDTFQETGGKHFLGLNPRLHNLHQEEGNEGAREGGKDEGGGVQRRWGKKTNTAGLVPPTLLLEDRVNAQRGPLLPSHCGPGACPPQGLPGPGPATRPPRRAAPNRCQPQRRPRHIWLRFAVILASPHRLTTDKKEQHPAATRPALPHRPLPLNSFQRSASPLHLQPGTALPAARWGTGTRSPPGLGPRTPSRAAPPQAGCGRTAASRAFQHSRAKEQRGDGSASSADRFLQRGGGERGRSPRSAGPPPARRTETNSPAQLTRSPPPPPAPTAGQEAPSKQVSGARHRGTLFAPAALTSLGESAPGAGRLARGPRGERRGAQRRPRPARAEAGCERVSGRRVRAGGSAAARRVLLLGRRRRLLQPSSQRRAAPGVRSTFSRSVPHAAPPEGSLPRAHTPPDRTLPSQNQQFGDQSERGGGGRSPTEVRRLGSPLGAAAAGGARGGATPTQCVRRSPSARRARRPCGPGRESAAAPPHIAGLRAEAERRSLPHERLTARTRARAAGRCREEPRHAQQRRGDAPQQSQGILRVSKQPGSAHDGPQLKRTDHGEADHA